MQTAPARYAPKQEDLQVIKPLGAGGFARVLMVRDRCTRRVYALKVISKNKLLKQNAKVRTLSVLYEKQALDEFNHPFVLSSAACFQDGTNLYLLMNLALGGELFRVMEEFDKLSELMASFYVASITLALQHIHMLDYVYRDLKPENVMLDQNGFVKVADFGFAKKVVDRTFTQCGTPDYVAPEMLMGQGVNQACDWWALGVLFYEMIAAIPPFTDPDGDDMAIFANILKGGLEWPDRDECAFSDDSRQLISGLLTVSVKNRLGYLKGGAEDLINHAWFREKVDWDALVNCSVRPPWVPKLKSATDTTYFEDTMDECENAHIEAQKELPLSPEVASEWSFLWQAFGTSEASTSHTPSPRSARSM